MFFAQDKLEEAKSKNREVDPELSRLEEKLKTTKQYMTEKHKLKEAIKKRKHELTTFSEDGIQHQIVKLKQELSKLTEKRFNSLIEHDKVFEKLTEKVLHLNQSPFAVFQYKACLDFAKSEESAVEVHLAEMHKRVIVATNEYNKAKLEVKKLKDIAEATAPLNQELLNQFNLLDEKIKNNIEAIKGEIDHLKVLASAAVQDHSVQQKFAALVEECKTLEKECEFARTSKDQHAARVKERIVLWRSKMEKVIKLIGEKFSSYYKRMGCMGEIILPNFDDNIKYSDVGLDVKLKYRDSAVVRTLGESFSGGERSVCAMLFLLCLQSVTECPFRVVDEINQGMDKTNEGIVFDRIVEAADLNADSKKPCQYFLLSPKLPNRENFSEQITFLFIYNGTYNLTSSEWNKVTQHLQKSMNKKRAREGSGNAVKNEKKQKL